MRRVPSTLSERSTAVWMSSPSPSRSCGRSFRARRAGPWTSGTSTPTWRAWIPTAPWCPRKTRFSRSRRRSPRSTPTRARSTSIPATAGALPATAGCPRAPASPTRTAPTRSAGAGSPRRSPKRRPRTWCARRTVRASCTRRTPTASATAAGIAATCSEASAIATAWASGPSPRTSSTWTRTRASAAGAA